MWNGTVKPAKLMIRGENASLCVVPPFLQKRKGMIGGRDDVLKAVWANRISSVLCGGVGGVVAR